eukprot:1060487-Amphidinium_carterae.2
MEWKSVSFIETSVSMASILPWTQNLAKRIQYMLFQSRDPGLRWLLFAISGLYVIVRFNSQHLHDS